MTNPIANHLAVSGITDRLDPGAPEARDAEQSAADVAATDQVTLTSDAQRLERVVAAARAEPDVDAAKVQALREAIESGQHTIDSDRITDALLEIDQVLQGR